MAKDRPPFTKHDADFIKHILEHSTLDKNTGSLNFNNFYVATHLNFMWRGNKVFLPHSHIVWFLTHGKWPKEGYIIDHINDNPQDNRPENLQELTQTESQKKRRGRMVYRSYGTGKYGYGLYVHHDKRDRRFYVSRNLSRGYGKGDLKGIKKSLGGFDTLEEAEEKVKSCIEEIKANSLDHMPTYDGKKQKKRSIELMVETKRLRTLRERGYSLAKISEITGIAVGSLYKRVKDIEVDKRSDRSPPKRIRQRLDD